MPPPPNSDRADWFASEIQPHESSLRAYLRASFPSVQDVDDVVQESYLRVLRSQSSSAAPIRLARAFLFSIARRLAIDHLRRRRVRNHGPVTDLIASHVLEESPGVAEIVNRRQEAELLARAIDSLPGRCREIVIQRKLDNATHREIAVRLGISEETVQVQLGRGMHKLAKYLRRHGVECP